MKIALITEYKKIGGGETNLIALAEALGRFHGCDVTVFADGEVACRAKAQGIKTISFDLTGERWWYFLPLVSSTDKKLCLILDEYDVVHSYSVNVLPRLYFTNKNNIVWTVHGAWERPNVRAIVAHVFLGLRFLVSVNREINGSIHWPFLKKSQIHLGTEFKPLSLRKNIKHSSSLSILCVARFQKIKGQAILVDALATIASHLSGILINVTFVGGVTEGDATGYEYMQATVKNAGLVSDRYSNLTFNFVGYQKNTSPFYENADVVVVPSIYESFSMVCIEALGHGLPVIAPRTDGPGMIINSTKIGALFQPGNSADLAEKIVDFIEGHENYNTVDCFNRAQDFDIRKQSERLLSVYSELVKNINRNRFLKIRGVFWKK